MTQVPGQMSIFDLGYDLDYGAGRTSQEPSAATTAMISDELLKKWQGSSSRPPIYLNLQSGGVQEWWTVTDGRLPGAQWMPNFSESPKDAEDCFLWQILEEDVPQKYFLSEKACLGILRRSHLRSKTLPEVLETALVRQAGLSWEEYEEKKKEWVA